MTLNISINEKKKKFEGCVPYFYKHFNIENYQNINNIKSENMR